MSCKLRRYFFAVGYGDVTVGPDSLHCWKSCVSVLFYDMKKTQTDVEAAV